MKNKECAVIRKQQTKTNKKKRWRKEGPRGEQASKARVCKWQQQNKRKATKRNETQGRDRERGRGREREGGESSKVHRCMEVKRKGQRNKGGMEVGGWVMEMLLSLIRVIAITIILRVVHDIRVF